MVCIGALYVRVAKLVNAPRYKGAHCRFNSCLSHFTVAKGVHMNRKNQFIIFNPSYPTPPTRWFDSRHEAQAVARKMAEGSSDTFYVLKAVSQTQRIAATTVDYE